MIIPGIQFSYNHPALYIYEHRQSILQWSASVPGNIPKALIHVQSTSRDNQVVLSWDSTSSSPKQP